MAGVTGDSSSGPSAEAHEERTREQIGRGGAIHRAPHNLSELLARLSLNPTSTLPIAAALVDSARRRQRGLSELDIPALQDVMVPSCADAVQRLATWAATSPAANAALAAECARVIGARQLSRKRVGLPAPSFFVHRRSLEERLNAALMEREHSVVVVWGPGGAGKTQLALRFVETAGARYSLVVWLLAESLVESCAAAAAELCGVRPKPEDAVALLARLLAEGHDPPRSGSLLVLDNADSVEWSALVPLVRECRCHVIVTSRNANLVDHATASVAVKAMSEAEAVEVLKGDDPDEAADETVLVELAQELDRLPLALGLARSLSRRWGAVRLVRELKADLLSSGTSGPTIARSDLIVERLVVRSIDLIKTAYPGRDDMAMAIATVVCACGFTEAECIPQRLLKGVLAHRGVLDATASAVIDAMVQNCVLRGRREDGDLFDIHRLAQAALRRYATERAVPALSGCLAALHQQFRYDQYALDVDTPALLASHVIRVLHHAESAEAVTDRRMRGDCHLVLSAWCVRQGQYPEALAHANAGRQVRLSDVPVDAALVAEALYHVACTEQRLGSYSIASGRLAEALQAIPAGHALRFDILWEIGDVEWKQGRYQHALDTYNTCLAALCPEDAKHDMRLAFTLHQIGRVHASLGRRADALPKYEESLAMKRKVLPADHPEVAITLHEIGSIYLSMGLHTDALAKYEESLEMKRRVLPADHPSVSATLHQVGSVYLSMDRHADALAKYEESLAMKRRVVPADHPDVAITLHNIGRVYSSMGRHADALAKYEECLAMERRVLPADHPEVAITLHNIGSVYSSMGRHADALAKYEASLAMKRRVLPADHPEVAITLHQIGRVYSSMGRHADALAKYEASLAMQRRVLPADHPDLKVTLRSIASLQRRA